MSDSKSRFLMYRYSHTFYYDRLVCSNWKNRAMYGYLILFYGWVVLTRGYGVDEFIYFDIVQPSQLAFLYKILPAKDFGGLFDNKYSNIGLVPSEPLTACAPLVNIHHNEFVLAVRGECSFVTKAYNVQQAGAVGVIIYNNERHDQFISMLSDDELSHMSNAVTIPTAFLRGTDGQRIVQVLEQLELDNVLITIPVNITGTNRLLWNNAPWNLI